jgi:integrase
MPRKKQKGNGTGTVYPRKNKVGKIIGYRGSYFGPDGKRRYVSAKTKGEAERALRRVMTDAERGLVSETGTVTVEEYLNRWLTDSVRDTVRNTTFERYEQIARKHIVPENGRVKLKALTPAHVRGLYRKKLEAGLSPRTVQYVHVTLHKALKQAVRDGLVPRNATEAVKPPQVRREEIRPLTLEQVKTLFEAAKGDRREALYVLAVTTGLRQGERLGLKWDDVDMDAETLSVRRTLTTAKGGPVLSAPKTKGSRRTVRLSQTAQRALRSHLERQLREIERAVICGGRTASSLPPRWGSPWTDATSLCVASSPYSRRRGCHSSASTTSATRAPRCCCPRTSTPRSSRRCSDTRP